MKYRRHWVNNWKVREKKLRDSWKHRIWLCCTRILQSLAIPLPGQYSRQFDGIYKKNVGVRPEPRLLRFLKNFKAENLVLLSLSVAGQTLANVNYFAFNVTKSGTWDSGRGWGGVGGCDQGWGNLDGFFQDISPTLQLVLASQGMGRGGGIWMFETTYKACNAVNQLCWELPNIMSVSE
jgi:hypothetical protein